VRERRAIERREAVNGPTGSVSLFCIDCGASGVPISNVTMLCNACEKKKADPAMKFTAAKPPMPGQAAAAPTQAGAKATGESAATLWDRPRPQSGSGSESVDRRDNTRTSPLGKRIWPLAIMILTVAVAIPLLIAIANTKWWHSRFAHARAQTPKGVLVETVKGLRIEMVSIPEAEFKMGTDTGEDDEKPAHLVKLGAFWLGKTEVTQGVWLAVMGENPAHFQEGHDYPVENVSWDDCQAFIARLNGLTGGHYRLPTEAEWEHACRAGMPADRYGVVEMIAWFAGNAGGKTHSVSGKQPNDFGLYDMLGNVWEWCQDRYSDSYYGEFIALNPLGPVTGSGRVIRGASWNNYKESIRATYRNGVKNDFRSDNLGLRLAGDQE
jgi:formylglycine-generating enzyme required for sulfatase activity